MPPIVETSLDIPTAAVFEPLLEPSRYKGAHGGRGSAKSNFFADQVIERTKVKSGTRLVCVREIQKSLEQSVKRLLEDKIKTFGLGSDFRVTNTHIETPGDGIIIFNGMQNHTAESIKSLEGYDIAWVEEAQSLSQRSLDLLRPTIRKPDSEIWFSWNPRFATDPVDVFLRKNRPPNAVVVEANYRDNPWFPDVLKTEMEWDRRIDIDKYKHIWMGGYEEHSESRVFKNWRVEEFETPSGVSFLLGGDWGFSVDPSVLVRCYVILPTEAEKKVNPLARKKLYIDQECYKIGVEVDHLPAFFDLMDNGKMRQHVIVADSARPETISYLRRHGYPGIEAAKKGPNSVKEGVLFLQAFEIIVHPRCVHTADELTMYSYVVDPLTALVTGVLEDKKNHVIDSVRYATERIRGILKTERATILG